MIIEQLVIDYEKEIGPQLKELALDDNVYILFNAYNTTYRLYEKAKHLHPEELRWENCWRLRPFKDYYYKNRDNDFFEETLRMNLQRGIAIIRIK